MSKFNSPTVIFDSRTAKKNYAELNYYRSSDIVVPGGCVAIVELTAHREYIKRMTFTAIRVPAQGKQSECYDNSCLGKRYRRWKCCQSLGEDIEGSNTDPFARSVVRWGFDGVTNEVVEFEFIVRPGVFYLIATKCNNEDIEDCANPTIIEATIVPVDRIPELGLPCCE